jgi:hypothetical protein
LSHRLQNGSLDITLKNMPEPVYRAIQRQAKKERRSLNAQLIHTLEAEATLIGQRRRLKALRKEFDGFAASLPPMGDSARLIRQDRRR